MATLGSLLAAFPGAAGAASPVINELKIRESVKGVKESVEALKLYEDFVATKDFYGIKKSLRVPPVSEIRRDCPVSYTHLRAHETSLHLVCRLLLEKNFFFNDTATTEIYTLHIVGSVKCV